ncbi:MAG TPA: methyltransferase domain-containing protein [Vicinamibacterales bacterium]|nr:methyltransferase domain-containing protein [Vicinamibacterales bacterium]
MTYNALAWIYGLVAAKRSVRHAAYMRAFKDSRFDDSQLWMASAQPRKLLDAVIERWRPRSFLDVGCGTGRTLEYVAGKGIECLGLEGSRAAVQASAVKQLIRLVNLNDPVNLGRTFDVIWSYEVAEHIHPVHTHTFLATLTQHGDKVVMSAAPPGQGGAGHFNEQPPSYWIAKMSERAFVYDDEFSQLLHTLPEDHSRNMMVFVRRKT